MYNSATSSPFKPPVLVTAASTIRDFLIKFAYNFEVRISKTTITKAIAKMDTALRH